MDAKDEQNLFQQSIFRRRKIRITILLLYKHYNSKIIMLVSNEQAII